MFGVDPPNTNAEQHSETFLHPNKPSTAVLQQEQMFSWASAKHI